MIAKYLVSMLVILVLFGVWLAVQHFARRFAARHPELGPRREEGMGCGIGCKCLSAGEKEECRLNPTQRKIT